MNWFQRFKKSTAYTQANIICTFVVMLATVAYVIVAGMQLLEIKRTNELTQQALNGSGDALNKTLAKMQGQVDATNALAGHAKDQADKAAVIAANSDIQTRASQESASAAQRNANTAKDAMQATIDSFHNGDRAWVGISNANPISFGGSAAAQSANMQVAFTLRNYGHSAAENIRFLAVLESDPTISTLSCDEVDKIHATMVLLPTQEHTLNWAMTLTPDQIAKGWSHQNPALEKILSLRIVGCIDYTDRGGERPTHRTPFNYLVFRSHGGFITLDTTLSGDEISLDSMFENAGSSQVH